MFLQFQPEVKQKFFSCRRFDYCSVVVFFKHNTVVETSATKELLLNFGLELKKVRDGYEGN